MKDEVNYGTFNPLEYVYFPAILVFFTTNHQLIQLGLISQISELSLRSYLQVILHIYLKILMESIYPALDESALLKQRE